MTSEEEKDLTVKAPSKSFIPAEKKIEKDIEKALEEERFSVLRFPNEIGKYLGVVVVATGILLLSFFAYISITGQTIDILLSMQAGSLGLALWIFVGLINFILGLLFLGRE